MVAKVLFYCYLLVLSLYYHTWSTFHAKDGILIFADRLITLYVVFEMVAKVSKTPYCVTCTHTYSGIYDIITNS